MHLALEQMGCGSDEVLQSKPGAGWAGEEFGAVHGDINTVDNAYTTGVRVRLRPYNINLAPTDEPNSKYRIRPSLDPSSRGLYEFGIVAPTHRITWAGHWDQQAASAQVRTHDKPQ